MLRRVAAFCRPLRPVLLLVSFPRSRSPVVGVLGLCWMWRDVLFACQRRPMIPPPFALSPPPQPSTPLHSPPPPSTPLHNPTIPSTALHSLWGLWRAVEGCGGLWRTVEGCGGVWRGMALALAAGLHSRCGRPSPPPPHARHGTPASPSLPSFVRPLCEHEGGGVWRGVEGCGGLWRAVGGGGEQRSALEGGGGVWKGVGGLQSCGAV